MLDDVQYTFQNLTPNKITVSREVTTCTFVDKYQSYGGPMYQNIRRHVWNIAGVILTILNG
jgi:hypothetical protein